MREEGRQLTLIPNVCSSCKGKFDATFSMRKCVICGKEFCGDHVCDEEGRTLEDNINNSQNFYYVCGGCIQKGGEVTNTLLRINELKQIYDKMVETVYAEFFPLQDKLRKANIQPSSSMIDSGGYCKGAKSKRYGK